MADITIAWDTANGRGDWVLNPPTVAQTPIMISSPQQFGVGDGIATQFALVYSQSAISNAVAQIYRNDWQGNQLLYATPRTNSVLQSQTFDNASWTKTRATITTNATTAPDGTLTADKLVEDTTATNTHSILESVTVPANAVVTYSVFVKAAERTWTCVQLGNFANQVNPQALYVNLSTGAFNVADASRVSVTAYPNGWWRISTTVTAVASSVALGPSVYTATNGSFRHRLLHRTSSRPRQPSRSQITRCHRAGR
jgi:hypothetical protein